MLKSKLKNCTLELMFVWIDVEIEIETEISRPEIRWRYDVGR